MPRNLASKYLQSIAHHEAGHAIAAWSIGMEPKSISIVPDKISSGRYRHHPYFASLPPYFTNAPSPEGQRRLEEATVVCFAGGEAQRLFNPQGFRWADCEGDHLIAEEFVAALTGGDYGEEFKAYWKLLHIRAKNLVRHRQNWRLIKVVSRALLKKREFTGEELSEVLENAL